MRKVERHGGKGTPLYAVWKTMVQRCENPANLKWSTYGGRGVKVCQRWRESFAAFRADVGPRPVGMSLDRVDVNKGYSPDNCRWATASLQARNSRVRTDNSTGLKGVSYVLRKKVWKYHVHISVGGVRKHLGYTPSLLEAACLRKSAELRFNYFA